MPDLADRLTDVDGIGPATAETIAEAFNGVEELRETVTDLPDGYAPAKLSRLDGFAPTVDGLAIGEPKFLECDTCGASVRIDGPDGHQTAIDDLPHDRSCPQRDVVSEYFEERYVR